MFNFHFLKIGFSAAFCPRLTTKMFRRCILLTDQISLPDCLYLLSYLAISALQLFAIQFATALILVFILAFLLSRFPT